MCSGDLCVNLASAPPSEGGLGLADVHTLPQSWGQLWTLNKCTANLLLGEWPAFLMFLLLGMMLCICCVSTVRGALRWALGDLLKVKPRKEHKSRHRTDN